MEEQPQNPVSVKWKEVATELAALQRRIASLSERRDELAKKEAMLRGALQEAEIALPTLDSISQPRRRLSRDRLEDMVLKVVFHGESVDASEVLRRFELAGFDIPSTNPSAAIRTAMRRSPSFSFVKRGIFRRQDGGVTELQKEEAPSPEEGDGAS